MECQHKETYELKGPFGPHYAKRECTGCAKFMGWVPAPKPVGAVADKADLFAILLSGDLSEWEQSFLKSIQRQRVWSDKQQQHFDKICGKYLKGSVKTAPSRPAPASDDELAGIF